MIVPVLALLCCNTVFADIPKPAPASAGIAETSSAVSESPKKTEPTKPDSPAPKLAAFSSDASESEREASTSTGRSAILSSPVKAASRESFETPRKRAIWYGLAAAGHGTAAFDAWTTRRAISHGYGVESNPLERPFASSGAIYATTQVSPLIMDFLGRRMMHSSHSWMRRFWWVPQAAGASFSLGAGIHNYRVAP